jgi:hypothetical protein
MIATVPALTQWLNYPTLAIPRTPDGTPDLSAPTPKTADGKPDLSGLWMATKHTDGIAQVKPSEIEPCAR